MILLLHTLAILNKFFVHCITWSVKPCLQKKNKRSYCFITYNSAEWALIYSAECISLKKLKVIVWKEKEVHGLMEKGKGSTAQHGAFTLYECFNSTTEQSKFIPAVMHGGFKAGRFVFMACCKINNISSFIAQVVRVLCLRKYFKRTEISIWFFLKNFNGK